MFMPRVGHLRWNRLQGDIDAGKVATVVVWRLHRLGRTAKGLTALFEALAGRKVGLVSLKEGLWTYRRQQAV